MRAIESLREAMLGEQLSSDLSFRQRIGIMAGTIVMAANMSALTINVGEGVAEDLAHCPAPSPATIQMVTAMFDSPPPRPVYSSSNPYERSDELDQFLEQKRQELNVDLPHIDLKKLNKLELPLKTTTEDDRKPFSEYLNATRGILDQLDIPLVVNSSSEVTSKKPTDAELGYLGKHRLTLQTNLISLKLPSQHTLKVLKG